MRRSVETLRQTHVVDMDDPMPALLAMHRSGRQRVARATDEKGGKLPRGFFHEEPPMRAAEPANLLRVYVARARRLPKIRTVGKVNACTLLEYSTEEYPLQTKIKASTQEPVWNETFEYARTEPTPRPEEPKKKDAADGEAMLGGDDDAEAAKKKPAKAVLMGEVGKTKVIKCPAGDLGVNLQSSDKFKKHWASKLPLPWLKKAEEKPEAGPAVASKDSPRIIDLKEGSPLKGFIDVHVAVTKVDEVDTTRMSAPELAELLVKRKDKERTIIVLPLSEVIGGKDRKIGEDDGKAKKKGGKAKYKRNTDKTVLNIILNDKDASGAVTLIGRADLPLWEVDGRHPVHKWFEITNNERIPRPREKVGKVEVVAQWLYHPDPDTPEGAAFLARERAAAEAARLAAIEASFFVDDKYFCPDDPSLPVNELRCEVLRAKGMEERDEDAEIFGDFVEFELSKAKLKPKPPRGKKRPRAPAAPVVPKLLIKKTISVKDDDPVFRFKLALDRESEKPDEAEDTVTVTMKRRLKEGNVVLGTATLPLSDFAKREPVRQWLSLRAPPRPPTPPGEEGAGDAAADKIAGDGAEHKDDGAPAAEGAAAKAATRAVANLAQVQARADAALVAIAEGTDGAAEEQIEAAAALKLAIKEAADAEAAAAAEATGAAAAAAEADADAAAGLTEYTGGAIDLVLYWWHNTALDPPPEPEAVPEGAVPAATPAAAATAARDFVDEDGDGVDDETGQTLDAYWDDDPANRRALNQGDVNWLQTKFHGKVPDCPGCAAWYKQRLEGDTDADHEALGWSFRGETDDEANPFIHMCKKWKPPEVDKSKLCTACNKAMPAIGGVALIQAALGTGDANNLCEKFCSEGCAKLHAITVLGEPPTGAAADRLRKKACAKLGFDPEDEAVLVLGIAATAGGGSQKAHARLQRQISDRQIVDAEAVARPVSPWRPKASSEKKVTFIGSPRRRGCAKAKPLHETRARVEPNGTQSGITPKGMSRSPSIAKEQMQEMEYTAQLAADWARDLTESMLRHHEEHSDTGLAWDFVQPGDDKPEVEAATVVSVTVAAVEARGLKNADLVGKSDPYVSVCVDDGPASATPHVNSSLDPTFDVEKSTFLFDRVSDLSVLKAEVRDYDGLSKVGRKDDLLGRFELTLDALCGLLDPAAASADQEAELDEWHDLADGKGQLRLRLTVKSRRVRSGTGAGVTPAPDAVDLMLGRALPEGFFPGEAGDSRILEEETPANELRVHVAHGRKVAAVDLMGGASDPYVVLAVAGPDGGAAQTARTLVKDDTDSPYWGETFAFELRSLDAPMALELFDADFLTQDDVIGRSDVDLASLAGGQLEHRTVTTRLEVGVVRKRIQARGEVDLILQWVHNPKLDGAPPPPKPVRNSKEEIVASLAWERAPRSELELLTAETEKSGTAEQMAAELFQVYATHSEKNGVTQRYTCDEDFSDDIAVPTGVERTDVALFAPEGGRGAAVLWRNDSEAQGLSAVTLHERFDLEVKNVELWLIKLGPKRQGAAAVAQGGVHLCKGDAPLEFETIKTKAGDDAVGLSYAMTLLPGERLLAVLHRVDRDLPCGVFRVGAANLQRTLLLPDFFAYAEDALAEQAAEAERGTFYTRLARETRLRGAETDFALDHAAGIKCHQLAIDGGTAILLCNRSDSQRIELEYHFSILENVEVVTVNLGPGGEYPEPALDHPELLPGGAVRRPGEAPMLEVPIELGEHVLILVMAREQPGIAKCSWRIKHTIRHQIAKIGGTTSGMVGNARPTKLLTKTQRGVRLLARLLRDELSATTALSPASPTKRRGRGGGKAGSYYWGGAEASPGGDGDGEQSVVLPPVFGTRGGSTP